MSNRRLVKYYRYEFLGRHIPSFNMVGPANDEQAKQVLRWFIRPFLKCIPVFAGEEDPPLSEPRVEMSHCDEGEWRLRRDGICNSCGCRVGEKCARHPLPHYLGGDEADQYPWVR